MATGSSGRDGSMPVASMSGPSYGTGSGNRNAAESAIADQAPICAR
jgi:hypothetical protein